MSWARAEVVASVGEPPPRRWPEMRRVSCGCGCGAWFYAPRRRNRPPLYLNHDHALWARGQRRRAR